MKMRKRVANRMKTNEKTGIVGVRLIGLASHEDARGYFREIFRKSRQRFLVRQISVSLTKPGVIKAFHWHKKQQDAWHLVSGKALVVLHDLRPGSATRGKTLSFEWNADQKPQLLIVPKKVVHGYKALGKKPMVMLYYMDREYNAKKPDEERIALDDPVIGFNWKTAGTRKKR